MKKFAQDSHFYVVLTLGPIVWVGLSFILPVQAGIEKLAAEPWLLLSSVLVYPILEEVVFRGLILEAISARTVGRRIGLVTFANLLTSLLFVAAHFIYHPWNWALVVFFPSLVFGYMKERHQSLWPPIILHVFYNLGFFILFV